jgi:EmrB/QacA subfamily drug resistance transporter
VEAGPEIKRNWWALVAVCVGTFMLLLDITVVNVALPSIQKDLDASLSDLQWVVDAYSLTLAAFLLTAGSLADRLGRRRLFVAGLAIFSFASLLCALAQSPTMLNLSRGLQGIGGAGMFATSLALIAQEFEGRDRATAIGAWGATIGGAVAIGPLVGGILTDSLGWEWIFLVNVPIGLGAIWLTMTKISESRDPDALGIDWPGLVTFSGALFLLIYGLVRGNPDGWSSASIVASLVGAAVLMIAFVAIETRSTHPMLDLKLFRNRSFKAVSVVAFALSASMFSMFLYLTLYIQGVLGFDALQAGLRFLPITLLSFFVAPVAGRFTDRVPARLFLGIGLLLVGGGLLLMRGVTVGDEWTALLPGFLITGFGVGLINPSIASSAIAVVPVARSGMGSGISNTFRQVGIATGIAGLGAVFQSRIADELGHTAPKAPPAFADAVASGGANQALAQAPPASRGQLLDAAQSAFVVAFNEILLIAAIVALVGGVVGLLFVRESDFYGQQAPERAPVPSPSEATA